MRRYLFLLFLPLFAAAQNPRFMEALQKNKSILDTAHSLEAFQNVGNTMERIAGVERKEWLASYYAAFAHTLQGFYTKENQMKDDLYDKAMLEANRADSLSPNNSEIYTLKGMIYQMQLQVSPMTRGQKLGPQATVMFDKAIELDPNNPRPYYLKGQGLFYTPPIFGGGKDKALPVLQQAVDKYSAFKPSIPVMPDWGANRARQLLEECKK